VYSGMKVCGRRSSRCLTTRRDRPTHHCAIPSPLFFSSMKRLALVLAILAASPLNAQQPAACSAPQHRQFDFWIGEWDVTDTRGQRVGTNRIERIVGGCALAESWEGTSGSRGRSLNAWDPGDSKWHQTWVDNEGTVLEIAGGIINGEMVMEGERRLADGTQTLERIAWTPNKDGTVRQFWQSSRDRGMRWAVVFDGLYRKRP
jgi:hypothetical protein